MSSSCAMYTPRKNAEDCFARFYCSGGCAANSYNFHGSITDAYDIGCEMQKKRIECCHYDQGCAGRGRIITMNRKVSQRNTDKSKETTMKNKKGKGFLGLLLHACSVWLFSVISAIDSMG